MNDAHHPIGEGVRKVLAEWQWREKERAGVGLVCKDFYSVVKSRGEAGPLRPVSLVLLVLLVLVAGQQVLRADLVALAGDLVEGPVDEVLVVGVLDLAGVHVHVHFREHWRQHCVQEDHGEQEECESGVHFTGSRQSGD